MTATRGQGCSGALRNGIASFCRLKSTIRLHSVRVLTRRTPFPLLSAVATYAASGFPLSDGDAFSKEHVSIGGRDRVCFYQPVNGPM